MVGTLLLLAVDFAAAWALRRHVVRCFSGASWIGRRLEEGIFRLLGVNPREEQTVLGYAGSLVGFNLLAGGGAFLALWLWPERSLGITAALHTAVSFVTNTNLQHYVPEAELDPWAAVLVLLPLMFLAPATGISALFAFTRALSRLPAPEGVSWTRWPCGSFYADLVRVTIRLLLPLGLALGMLLLSQGVPQTPPRELRLAGLAGEERTLVLGPLASWEAIKHLGTNGGGYFSANSAHPFENPTSASNLLEAGAMLLLPLALPLAWGEMLAGDDPALKRRGLRLGAAMALAMVLLFLSVWMPVELGMRRADLDGLELRFGREGTALFTAVTTTATTGSVNSTLAALPPLVQLGGLWGMMLNCAFGGDGVGLLNLLSYAVLAVFLASLMAGRTPVLFGRRVGTREVALAAGSVLLHPLLVLAPLALAGIFSPSPIPGGGREQFLRLLWEFASSSANNGSSLALAPTPALDLAGAGVMFLSRYVPLALQLCLGASLAAGQPAEEFSVVSLESPLFVLFLAGVAVVLGALAFLPALVLGFFGG